MAGWLAPCNCPLPAREQINPQPCFSRPWQGLPFETSTGCTFSHSSLHQSKKSQVFALRKHSLPHLEPRATAIIDNVM